MIAASEQSWQRPTTTTTVSVLEIQWSACNARKDRYDKCHVAMRQLGQQSTLAETDNNNDTNSKASVRRAQRPLCKMTRETVVSEQR